MYDKDLATKVDLTSVDEVEEMVRSISKMICAEQPDMPEPESLRDMDSFSVVQVLLEIENTTDRKLLEKIDNFIDGEEFRDLAEYLVKIMNEPDEAPSGEAATNGSADAAASPVAEAEATLQAEAEKNGSAAPKAEVETKAETNGAAPKAETAPEGGPTPA
jgi:hypothetical protein